MDLSFPALGGELSFVRSYASLATDVYTSVLGFGWTHNLDTRLITETMPGGVAGQVLFKAHSANEYIFFVNDDGTYSPYPGVGAELTRNGDGTYSLVMADQTRYDFDAGGKVTARTDPAGHARAYTYDGQNRLYRVTAGTRYIQLGYNAPGQIDTVSDHAGRSLTFQYTSGDLTSVIDVLGNTWIYHYDGASHRLTEEIDPEGKTVERTEYDATSGKALRRYNGQNELILELTYNAGGTTAVADGLGQVVTDTYTTLNTLAGQLNPLGDTTEQSFDANFQLQSDTDELGHTTGYEWSDDGANLTAITDALSQTTSLAYDTLNNTTAITDTRGFTTTFAYTGTLLTRSTDALQKSTLYTYTTAADAPQPAGLLTEATDPLGHTTTYTYNEFGQVVTMTDPVGSVTTYGYDNLGRVVTTTTAAGTALAQVTLTGYDAAGRVLTTTANYLAGQPQNYQHRYNLITTYRYDRAGRLVRTTDTLARADWTCYDGDGRVVRSVHNATGDGSTPQTDPCDATNYQPSSDPAFDLVSHTVYDANGNVIATLDAGGKITRTYYDELSRPAVVVDNLVGQAITVTTPPAFDPDYPDRNLTTRWGYDELGRVLTTTVYAGSAQQRIDWTCYDALGRMVRSVANASGNGGTPQTDPCNAASYQPSSDPAFDLVSTTVYDAAGNAIAQIDTVSRIARTYYDALYRPSVVVQNLTGQPITNTVPPSYNPAQPDANVRQETRYDAAGRDFETIDNAGMVVRTDYDQLSRPITVTTDYTHGGPVMRTAYDKLGNATSQTDASGVVTAYAYDELNRWSATVQNYQPGYEATADRNVRTDFTYDGRGNRLTMTDANGNVTRYGYDGLDRQVSVTDPLTHTMSYQYNGLGLTTVVTDANGAVTSYLYDGARRLTAIDYPAGTTDVSFTYNAANRTQMTDGVGTTVWAYDALGRPLTITAPLTGTVSYRYDRLGNRTQLVYPDGKVVTDTYTALSQLASLTDWASQVTGYQYAAAGQPLTTTLANGITSTYRYDTAQRLIGLTHTSITGTVAAYTYTLSAVGTRTSVTETLRQVGSSGAGDLIFADGFEAGSLSAWSSSTTDGGDLSVTTAAALVGSKGLQAVLDDNNAIFVTDQTPSAEPRYRARFSFDPNSISMGSNNAHYLLYGYTGASTLVLRVELRYSGGAYQLRAELRNDGNGWTSTNWFTISDAAHAIELDWRASTGPGANNGGLTFWIDGAQQADVTAIDNDTRRLDQVQWGAVAGIDSGTRGTYYFDAFESRRSTYIGPVPPEVVTYIVNYTYDALFRVTDAVYTNGDAFHYAYDAMGNVLTRTQTVLGQTVVTTYTYNAAHQLVTAKADTESTTWYYQYDNNGGLVAITPNGLAPANGAKRYSYDTAGQLVKAEQHDGSAYQAVSEMAYDGLGQRRQVIAWSGGISTTTTYAVDLARGGAVLAATASSQTTVYVHGLAGPLAELTASWGYYLPDGQATMRQLADGAGGVTLVRRYTPWGETLEQQGTGTFAWGYFGGLLDTATGLLYVGGGQYYDPATGRFLTRGAAPSAPNPYVPWQADPLGAALGPVGLLLFLRRRRGKQAGTDDRLVLLVVLLLGGSLALAACGTPTGTPTGAPANGTPTAPSIGTAKPTRTPGPPTSTRPATPTPTPSRTPSPTATPTCTPTVRPTPTPTQTSTPAGRVNMSAYYVTDENQYAGTSVPIPSAAPQWQWYYLWLTTDVGKYNVDVKYAQYAKEDFLYDATGVCYQGSGRLKSGRRISCITPVDWSGVASIERRRTGEAIDASQPDAVIGARQPASTFIGFEWATSRDLRPFRTVAICRDSTFMVEGDLLSIPELAPYLIANGGDGNLRVTDTGGKLCPTAEKNYETIDLFVGEGATAHASYLDFIGRPTNYPPGHPAYIPQFVTVYKR